VIPSKEVKGEGSPEKLTPKGVVYLGTSEKKDGEVGGDTTTGVPIGSIKHILGGD